MGKLTNKDVYIGCSTFDFKYYNGEFSTRLQKRADGFYTRKTKKGKFYWVADLGDTKHIFNINKMKSKIKGKRKWI